MICFLNDGWVDVLLDKLNQEWRPFQVMVLRDSSYASFSEENVLFRKVTARLPVIAVELSKVTNANLFAISRSTTVCVIVQMSQDLQDDVHFELVRNSIDFIVRLSPSSARPRCLMLSGKKSYQSVNLLEKMSVYAWSLKFLDFAIISINSEDTIRVFTYYPFTKRLASHPKLFPDKLRDMNKYELKVPFIHSSPYMRQKQTGTYVGTEYSIAQFLSEFLNFKLTVLDYNSGYPALKHSVKDLENSLLNFLPFTMFLGHPLTWNNTKIEKGVVVTFDNFCAIVSPLATEAQVDSPIGVLLSFLVSMGSILVIVLGVNRLKIMKQNHNTFTVCQLILQKSLVRLPESIRDRIIFFFIIILSMTYFEDIYARLTELGLKNIPTPLSSFEDIDRSGLTPYIAEGIFKWMFDDSDADNQTSVEAVKRKTRTADANSCIKYIIEGQRVICFVFESKGKMYAQNNTNLDGTSNIRIADFKVVVNGKNFVFENASPYVEKFNQVIGKLLEANLVDHWNRYNVLTRTPDYFMSENNLLIMQMVCIFIFGFIVSTMVFFAELAWNYYRQNKRPSSVVAI
ncbi:hypothetical protein TSAR_011020 [Trichomalopsis sarcophagae]|uniref:Ionotropic glutamate receptor C-terminal domain-containing protein n=1 Tax=Trichomalopsis sarcophagae TaxID=543379 RepID=A0A232FLQ6_9HYME|nr:hypothetical protein TSAR_011020 [Trichomalopsis sarcophagae]